MKGEIRVSQIIGTRIMALLKLSQDELARMFGFKDRSGCICDRNRCAARKGV